MAVIISPPPLSLSLSFHFPATAWVPDYATSLRQQTTVCWVLKHNFPTAKSAFNITDTIFWVHRNIWRLSYKMCLQEECIFLTYKHQCLQERHTNLSSRNSYILLPYKNTKRLAFPVKMYAFPKDTFYRTASGLLPGVNHVAHRSFSHYLGSLVP